MYAALPACLLGSGWQAARSELIETRTMIVNNDVYMALDANSSYVQLVFGLLFRSCASAADVRDDGTHFQG